MLQPRTNKAKKNTKKKTLALILVTLSLIATQVKHEPGHKSKHNASIIIRMSMEALICTGHDGRDISINIRRT